jgi:DHA1 family bicyclomycin/chloramphenicol resistance-like MFS transporter
MQRTPSTAFAATLALITLIGPLAVHLFLPAIPVVKHELGVSDALAQLTFSAALIAMAISTLAYGSIADNVGRRPALLSGLTLFLIGSVLSAMAPDIWTLVAGRVVQAAGAGCSLTLVRTIARDAYGQQHLVKAIAYLTMFYTMGPIFSPVVGGALIDAFGWRYLFGFAIAAGAAVLAASVLFIGETRPDRAADTPREHWTRAYRDLSSHVRFNAFVLQTGCNTCAFMVTATAASFMMKDTLGRSATEFGAYFALFPIGFLIGSAISSRLSGRVAIETMVLFGSLVLAAAVAIQAAFLLAGIVTPLTLCLPGLFITMGNGFSMPSAQAGAMAIIPRHAGTAAGIGVFMQMMVAGLGVQLYGLVSDGTVVPLVLTAGLFAAGTLATGVATFMLRRPAPSQAAGLAG